jgi:glyoxylase-like metal-dependent hydrolase (beta-lactamase superfamily II)
MSLKKILLSIALLIGLVLAGVGFFFWKTFRKFMVTATLQPDPHLTIFIGGASNSILLNAEDGSKALVVDTKMGADAKKLCEKVTAPEMVVVNTHIHPDHIGGNALYPSATFITGSYPQEKWPKDSQYPDQILEPGQEKVLQIGSETVHILNIGPAHSAQDLVVYLENRKLLVCGDLVFADIHPIFIDPDGNAIAWLKALADLEQRYAFRTLVAGHGGLMDRSALLTQKEYFASIRAAMNDPEKLALLKKKYAGYVSVPVVAGFEITVKALQKNTPS